MLALFWFCGGRDVGVLERVLVIVGVVVGGVVDIGNVVLVVTVALVWVCGVRSGVWTFFLVFVGVDVDAVVVVVLLRAVWWVVFGVVGDCCV